MKAYKVFNEDWTCNEFQYKVGETYEINGVIKPCNRGFHSCLKLVDCFNYYGFDPKNKVAEIEILGDKIQHGDKIVTNKIKIAKELSWQEVLLMVNIGKENTGFSNSGNSNSGNCNSGYRNSGDWNSGYRNSGNSNSGNWNSGNSNSGNWNSGNWNSGNSNSGNSNSGDWNSGYRNSGNSNSGNSNSGDWNSGYRNSGDWNSGDWNSGNSNSGNWNSGNSNSGNWNSGNSNSGNCNSGNWNSGNSNSGDWNSKTPEKIYFFNQLITYNELEKIKTSKAYRLLGRFSFVKYRVRTKTGKFGDYKYMSFKASFRYFWNKLSLKGKKEIISMPYFDNKVFAEITGIETINKKEIE